MHRYLKLQLLKFFSRRDMFLITELNMSISKRLIWGQGQTPEEYRREIFRISSITILIPTLHEIILVIQSISTKR